MTRYKGDSFCDNNLWLQSVVEIKHNHSSHHLNLYTCESGSLLSSKNLFLSQFCLAICMHRTVTIFFLSCFQILVFPYCIILIYCNFWDSTFALTYSLNRGKMW